MKFWPFSRAEKRASIENPATPISNPDHWLIDLLGGGPSSAGINVNAETALGVPVVWRCVNLIADTVASLPLHVFRGRGTGREVMRNSPINTLIHSRPNSELTSYRWRRMFMKHLLLHGRHFTRIERTGLGRPTGLFPLDPARVRVERRNGVLRYIVALEGGGSEVLPPDEILHFTGLDTDDGLDGVPVIARLKNAIGLAIALETYGAAFFRNGARPGLILEYPHRLSPEAIDRLKASIEATHGEVGKSHKVVVLEDGAKVHKVTVDPEQSQFTDARAAQRREVANIFGVPMFFLGDSDPARANSEQQALFFLKHTIRPWLVMLEQEMNLKLLTPTQARTQNIEFNVDGILRGDFKTRMDGFAQAIQNAIMTPNEVREKMNLPAKDGGDELVLQQNMARLGALQMELPLEENGDG
ncbi:MAG: phage portal protein [Alphaproteobacteria bacterium]|nr:MAG: phage portal protein [Alphaproteobacteria bacterium]